MPYPKPEPGLVIRYAFLWNDEAKRAQVEGKGRPCVIVGVRSDANGTDVIVAPITHSAPSRKDLAVELSAATSKRLGLDDGRSWIVTSELNRMRWPGLDLQARDPRNPDSVAYGFLPSGTANELKRTLKRAIELNLTRSVTRSEELGPRQGRADGRRSFAELVGRSGSLEAQRTHDRDLDEGRDRSR